jgi:hypothetical protein
MLLQSWFARRFHQSEIQLRSPGNSDHKTTDKKSLEFPAALVDPEGLMGPGPVEVERMEVWSHSSPSNQAEQSHNCQSLARNTSTEVIAA